LNTAEIRFFFGFSSSFPSFDSCFASGFASDFGSVLVSTDLVSLFFAPKRSFTMLITLSSSIEL
jgi:hypothetical protein